MSDFNYTMRIINAPAEGERGSRISLKVSVDEASEPVSRVYVSVGMYDVFEILRKESDTLFSLNYYIPDEAPAGNYEISLWAVNGKNEKGPVTYFKLKVC